MRWRPTPKAMLFVIRRYDRENGDWSDCDFADLKPGDIYASFSPDGREQVEPIGGAPDDDCLLVRGAPFKNAMTGYGYTVEVIAGPLADLLAMGLSS